MRLRGFLGIAQPLVLDMGDNADNSRITPDINCNALAYGILTRKIGVGQNAIDHRNPL